MSLNTIISTTNNNQSNKFTTSIRKFISFNIGAIYVFSILLISITSIIVLDSMMAFFDDEGNWSKQLESTKLKSLLLC